MICRKSDSESARLAADMLKAGKIVILPTDTVYGFSGIVDVPGNRPYAADAAIRAIKGRAETKPFIQLIADPSDLQRYSDEVIPKTLLSKWPGPLTIIVLRKDGVTTTAFRCPGDPWLRSIVAQCGAPVYSTSVNRSGSPVLTTEQEIVKEFSDEADLIITDGDRKNAVPSTIVRVDDGTVKVLRQGSVIV